MIKREIILLTIIFTAMFLICGSIFVSADGYDKYGIYVNDKKLDKNITVSVFNGFNYAPVNQMQAYLNITIKEDITTNSIIITQNSKTIKIVSGVSYEINGNKISQMDIPLIIRDNNIYLPVLAFVDLLGYDVEVMDEVKYIRIKTIKDAVPVGKLIDTELNTALAASKAISSSYPRVAYLTFDDGLDKKITPLILDILKEEDVKATFFIVGNTIKSNKSLLTRMVKEGHIIGNHTYTHKKENIYGSAAGLKDEIEKTNAAIYEAVGITTSLFRPPYGGPYINREDFKPVLSPYRTVLWNVDSMDSKSLSITSDEILNSVINQVKNKKSAVIIMHDSATHMETVKALPSIIRYLKENGFTILPIKENSSIYYQY